MNTEPETEEYRKLLDRIDRLCESLESLYCSHLACARGCCDCCKVERSVLPLEAQYILSCASACLSEKNDIEPDPDRRECAFLRSGICAIYPVRPVICRTHGLPLVYLSEEGDSWILTHCEKNFTSVPEDFSFAGDQVIDMESINQTLLSLNEIYKKKNRVTEERISLHEISARFPKER